jgi:hypothetical protein
LNFVNVGEYIDEEGKIDLVGLQAAVADVAKVRPHLVRQQRQRPRPTADGGAREGQTKTGLAIQERLATIKRDTGIS